MTEPLATKDNESWVRNPHYTFVRCSDDEIFAKHGRRSLFSEMVRDDARNGVLADIVDYLSQERLLSELRQTFSGVDKDDLEALLGWLADRGIVVNGPSAERRIDAYLRATGTLESSLANVRIGIVGGGAVGMRVARSLIEFGIGCIRQLSGVVIESVEDAHVVRLDVPAEVIPVNSATALGQHVLDTNSSSEFCAISGDENDSEQIKSVFEDVDLGS